MKLKIGMFYTICCCIDAEKITNKEQLEELQDIINSDDEEYLMYHFYETVEDLVKKECSCDGECENLEKLRNK